MLNWLFGRKREDFTAVERTLMLDCIEAYVQSQVERQSHLSPGQLEESLTCDDNIEAALKLRYKIIDEAPSS